MVHPNGKRGGSKVSFFSTSKHAIANIPVLIFCSSGWTITRSRTIHIGGFDVHNQFKEDQHVEYLSTSSTSCLRSASRRSNAISFRFRDTGSTILTPTAHKFYRNTATYWFQVAMWVVSNLRSNKMSWWRGYQPTWYVHFRLCNLLPDTL
jgi:hypothetical protein